MARVVGVTFMQNFIARFSADESGATAIEYALLASLIAVAIITGATTLGGKLNNVFNNLAGNIK